MKLPDYIIKNTTWQHSDCECPICGNKEIDSKDYRMTLQCDFEEWK